MNPFPAFKRWLGSVPARVNGSAIDLRREEVTRLHALAPVTDTVRQAELERRQCLARETLRMNERASISSLRKELQTAVASGDTDTAKRLTKTVTERLTA